MPPHVPVSAYAAAHGMPWNWHVQPSVGLTTHAWPAPQAPSHAGKVALPHGVLPATHSQPFTVTAQIGVAAGHSPQQSGCGGDIGSPHGSGSVVDDVVGGPEVDVVITMLELVELDDVVVLPGMTTSAGRQSSCGRTASSVSGRIWLLVDTAVRGSFGPRTR